MVLKYPLPLVIRFELRNSMGSLEIKIKQRTIIDPEEIPEEIISKACAAEFLPFIAKYELLT